MADDSPTGDEPRPRAQSLGAPASMPRVAGAGAAVARAVGAAAGTRPRSCSSQWAIAEVAPGRLLPWLPVAFGFGIVVYFTAEHEPACGRRARWRCVGIAAALLARHRAVGFPLALGVAAIAAGFAVATLQDARGIAHPVLQHAVWSVDACGLCRDARGARTHRPHRHARRSASTGGASPSRRSACASRCARARRRAVGSFVAAQGAAVAAAAAAAARRLRFRARHVFPADRRLRLSRSARSRPRRRRRRRRFGCATPSFIDGMREAIDDRIRAVLARRPRRHRFGADHRQARRHLARRSTTRCTSRASAHVLSISGYHMAVVAGIVFFSSARVLALVPVARAAAGRSRNGRRSARSSRRRSICCCRARRSRRSAPSS